ncbi:MAG: hypothetical protein ABT940_13450, partial [Alphaproteobacteria bacterium]
GGGSDLVTLGDNKSEFTMVSGGGPTSLIGTSGVDTVIVSGGVSVTGGTGADKITLATSGNGNTVVYSSGNDGGGSGSFNGADIVKNFRSGADKVVIGGALLAAVARGGNLLVNNEAQNGANNGDSVSVLTEAVAGNLNEGGMRKFLTALGTLASGSTSSSLLVIAHDSASLANSGLFLITEGSTTTVSSGQVKMLAYFEGVTLTVGDVSKA